MKIAVEGCAHGELEKIYDTIAYLERKDSTKVDLLICCGDFQSTRNNQDLECMAVPPKYRDICSFYKYYSGEKEAPILTIFIGGNHEASNYLSELAYGGWVAPNIYYLGYAGVIQVAGIRIAGLSGIFKGRDYKRGHFEKAPFSQNEMRSVYHIRNLEVFRLKQLSGKLDIALSHDWPRGVYHHGNLQQLLRFKPFFQEDIKSNSLGSEPAEELLHHLKPTYWFSAHLHCKFSALIRHFPEDDDDDDDENDAVIETTKFLALDKCLPRRRFLQILDIPHDTDKAIDLEYDPEWLTILSLTNHLLSVKETHTYMPGPGCDGRWKFTPTKEEVEFVQKKLLDNLKIPLNFSRTVEAFDVSKHAGNSTRQPDAQLNPQTMAFCKSLGIDDPIALLYKAEGRVPPVGSTFGPATDEKNESDLKNNSSVDPSDSCGLKHSLQGMKLPSPKLSSGMVLPEPRNSCEELGSESTLEERQDESGANKFTSSEPSEENPIVDSRTPLLDTPSPDNGCPQVKRFKRRNQAIYSTVDEDN